MVRSFLLLLLAAATCTAAPIGEICKDHKCFRLDGMMHVFGFQRSTEKWHCGMERGGCVCRCHPNNKCTFEFRGRYQHHCKKEKPSVVCDYTIKDTQTSIYKDISHFKQWIAGIGDVKESAVSLQTHSTKGWVGLKPFTLNVTVHADNSDKAFSLSTTLESQKTLDTIVAQAKAVINKTLILLPTTKCVLHDPVEEEEQKQCLSAYTNVVGGHTCKYLINWHLKFNPKVTTSKQARNLIATAHWRECGACASADSTIAQLSPKCATTYSDAADTCKTWIDSSIQAGKTVAQAADTIGREKPACSTCVETCASTMEIQHGHCEPCGVKNEIACTTIGKAYQDNKGCHSNFAINHKGICRTCGSNNFIPCTSKFQTNHGCSEDCTAVDSPDVSDPEPKFCRSCGGLNMPPCTAKLHTNKGCQNDLALSTGVSGIARCVQCGGANMLKCSTGPACISSCALDNYGKCRICGGRNQLACDWSTNGGCHDDHSRDEFAMCRTCGDLNELVCSKKYPASEGCHTHLDLLKVTSGHSSRCRACGGLNQPRCKYSRLQNVGCEYDYAADSKGICRQCGLTNRMPCTAKYFMNAGCDRGLNIDQNQVCRACGGEDRIPCKGGKCSGGFVPDFAGICRGCGAHNQLPCIDRYVDTNAGCNHDHTLHDKEVKCKECGRYNQPKCTAKYIDTNDGCHNHFTEDSHHICRDCGGERQLRCTARYVDKKSRSGCRTKELAPNAKGRCVFCGHVGMIPCVDLYMENNAGCKSTGVVSAVLDPKSQLCVACGQKDQRQCADRYMDANQGCHPQWAPEKGFCRMCGGLFEKKCTAKLLETCDDSEVGDLPEQGYRCTDGCEKAYAPNATGICVGCGMLNQIRCTDMYMDNFDQGCHKNLALDASGPFARCLPCGDRNQLTCKSRYLEHDVRNLGCQTHSGRHTLVRLGGYCMIDIGCGGYLQKPCKKKQNGRTVYTMFARTRGCHPELVSWHGYTQCVTVDHLFSRPISGVSPGSLLDETKNIDTVKTCMRTCADWTNCRAIVYKSADATCDRLDRTFEGSFKGTTTDALVADKKVAVVVGNQRDRDPHGGFGKMFTIAISGKSPGKTIRQYSKVVDISECYSKCVHDIKCHAIQYSKKAQRCITLPRTYGDNYKRTRDDSVVADQIVPIVGIGCGGLHEMDCITKHRCLDSGMWHNGHHCVTVDTLFTRPISGRAPTAKIVATKMGVKDLASCMEECSFNFKCWAIVFRRQEQRCAMLSENYERDYRPARDDSLVASKKFHVVMQPTKRQIKAAKWLASMGVPDPFKRDAKKVTAKSVFSN